MQPMVSSDRMMPSAASEDKDALDDAMRSSCHSYVARLDKALIAIESSAVGLYRVPTPDEPDSQIERQTVESHERI